MVHNLNLDIFLEQTEIRRIAANVKLIISYSDTTVAQRAKMARIFLSRCEARNINN